MPYKVEGNKVLHQKGGKWTVKQVAKNPTNAKKAMALLEGLEKGTIKPYQKKSKSKKKKGTLI